MMKLTSRGRKPVRLCSGQAPSGAVYLSMEMVGSVPRSCRFAVSLFALLVAAYAQDKPSFTSPLPTGLRLDPVGDAVELGSLPINLVVAPGDKVVVVLSGWREQGIQVVDLKTGQVTQTLLQDGAFYGAAFAPDGQHF